MKFLLLLIIILTAVLRIYDIETKNMWFDEVYSWKLSQKSVTEIVSDTSGDIHPPLYYIVLKYWTIIFTDSILSMRILSVITSLLSIFFIYKISKIVFNKNYLIVFVLLLYAVSPVNIFYSQEIRMLNLNLFLCLGSIFYFLISLKDRSYKNLFLFVLFSVLAIYTHYFAFLILFTEFIILLLLVLTKTKKFSETKKLYISIFLINLFYTPWYPVFLQQVSKGQPWRTVLTIKDSGINFLDYFKHLFLSVYYSFEPGYIDYLATFITYFILAFLLYSLFRFFNSKEKLGKDYNYIILFFFIPLIIASIISFRQTILFSRYLSILIPFLLITILFFSDKNLRKKFTVTLFIFLFSVSCLGAYVNYRNEFKNNDYRKIISYIEENFTDGDQILTEPHFMGWSIEYYRKHSHSSLPLPLIFGWNIDMQLDSLKNRNDLKNLWIIQDYSSLENEKYDSTFSRMEFMGFIISKDKTFYLVPSKVNVSKYTRSEIKNDRKY